MNQSLRVKSHQPTPQISTILSGEVTIPIHCDHCKHDTNVSLQQLKQQHPILCEHCYEVRDFSDAELALTRLMLANAGYHFAF